MIVKCVFAATNANGEPDFGFVKVKVSQKGYDEGHHYFIAEEWALDNDYEQPFVVFDESDGPDWLFEHFVWDSASVTPSQENCHEP